MTKLTRDTILNDLGFKCSGIMNIPEVKTFAPDLQQYESQCGRYTLTSENDEFLNLCNGAWKLHIDNSDMQTIANCEVEFVEQVRILMAIYKDY